MELWAVVYYVEPGIWQLSTIYNDMETARKQALTLKQIDSNYDYVRIQ